MMLPDMKLLLISLKSLLISKAICFHLCDVKDDRIFSLSALSLRLLVKGFNLKKEMVLKLGCFRRVIMMSLRCLILFMKAILERILFDCLLSLMVCLSS